MARALYRSRQVWHALHPRIDTSELEAARALLNEAQAQVFFAMQRRDQRHALEVAHRLQASGQTQPDLLVAALLHDCGKGAVPVWLRIAWVAVPGLVRALAKDGSKGVRGAAHRLVNHVPLGARRAEDAGCSPTTVRLIAGRATTDEAALAQALLTADDAS